MENGHANGVVAVLFDIDGTLITTGGADAVAWRMAFDDLYGIPADIGRFSDAGMTDPEVGRRTFVAVLARRLAHLYARVAVVDRRADGLGDVVELHRGTVPRTPALLQTSAFTVWPDAELRPAQVR